MKADRCPGCSKKLDAVTEIPKGNYKPRPGDISICFYCGQILVFDFDLKLQVAQLNDLMTLSPWQHRMLDQAQSKIKRRRK